MPPLPDDFQWQSEMADLIYTDKLPDSVMATERGWRCANAIDADTVLMIYRRNLKRGIESNLATQYPVTRAYLGAAGFSLAARSLLQVHPPRSPLFDVFAAQFPAFILVFDHFNDQLRCAASALASIDFFSTHVTVVDQTLDMDQRYYELYQSIVKIQSDLDVDSNDQPGMYQSPQLHPERVADRSHVAGHLYSHLNGDDLIVKYQST